MRSVLSDPIFTLSAKVVSVARLNDSTPNGPSTGYSLIAVDSDGNLWIWNADIGLAKIATGLSGNPVSMIPFRPNASVQPWMYIGDSAPQGNVTIYTTPAATVAGGGSFAVPGETAFVCNGMLKVRSDGLIYKMGIKEPASPPTVSTENTSVPFSGTLQATAIPWTNYTGQNPDYDYGEANGEPDPTPDGTAPFIVDCANASTITITALSGSATVNGATHGPTDSSSAWVVPANPGFPGQFIQVAGTGDTPSTASVVIGAFTDGAGNVIPAGVAPLFVPSVVDVGAAFSGSLTIQVPYGAQAFQIGINSEGDTFSANSGSFTIAGEVTTAALPSVTGIVDQLSLYYWGDSPQSGPVSAYIWKNPGDTGGGTARSTSNAIGNTSGNSFILDATFTSGIPGLPGVGTEDIAMQWSSLSPESAVVGSSPVFSSPITNPYTTNTYFSNFNFCLYGQIYFPMEGDYTLVLTNHDDCIWGIEGVSLVSAVASGSGEGSGVGLSTSGQTITVAKGYPLLPRQNYTSGEDGDYAQTTVVVRVTAAGTYRIEIDYDYWFHSGRILLLECSPTPGASPTIIPPLTQNARESVSYAGVYRSSITGATSNPSPPTTPETTPVLANTVELPYSDDPQVDKCDYSRQDSGLPNYTFVGTGPNTNPPIAITDSLTDAEAASNPTLDYDNFEPVPSIDLPRAGTCNVSGGVITRTGGDFFNMRWLPGTVIEIGSPTQLAYTFISRPTSDTEVAIPGVPDGTDLVWNIAEPILANQPLAYLFGPTDNVNFAYGVGDPLRPGTDYWCKGGNLDAWPDTNQQDVTDPSEALVNGAMSSGLAVLASIKRVWIVMPNFFDATATSTGTQGSTWTNQATTIPRGLYMPRCLYVEGGGLAFFRVQDGIMVSKSGMGAKSITDDELYPLFPHENSTPEPIVRNGVTIYPPDDTVPQAQQFSGDGQFVYYDYQGMDGEPHTLVFDIEEMGWIWDIPEPKIAIHASNVGQSVQGVLAGCADNTVRTLGTSGVETPSAQVLTGAIGGAGYQTMSGFTLEYASQDDITLTPLVVDEGNESYAPQPVTLPATGGAVTKYRGWFTPNKFKLIQFAISFTDPSAVIYMEGAEVDMRNWGSDGPYRQVALFGAEGGFGGQN